MAGVFPQWSNTALRVSLALLCLIPLGLLTLLCVYVRTPWNTGQFLPRAQPIQFDHRHHVVDDEIDCLYCHSGAETTAFAGVPATEVCMGCHAQVWNNSPLLDDVRSSYFSGQPIAWQRVHRLPDFVYFNHAVHVRRGLGCATCHGRVDQMPRVYQVAALDMGWCLDCHRRAQGLRSPRRRSDDERPSSLWGDARLTAELAQSRVDHSVTALTTCTACHR
jgi:hypothetical protein